MPFSVATVDLCFSYALISLSRQELGGCWVGNGRCGIHVRLVMMRREGVEIHLIITCLSLSFCFIAKGSLRLNMIKWREAKQREKENTLAYGQWWIRSLSPFISLPLRPNPKQEGKATSHTTTAGTKLRRNNNYEIQCGHRDKWTQTQRVLQLLQRVLSMQIGSPYALHYRTAGWSLYCWTIITWEHRMTALPLDPCILPKIWYRRRTCIHSSS